MVPPGNSYRFNHPTNHPYFLLEPCHHQYYPQQFIKSGFTPIANYFSSKGGVLPDTSQDALNLQNTFRDMNVNIRTIDTEIFDKELENLYPFIQSAFKNNFLYSPIRWEEFRKKYIEALQIVNSEFVLIAEDSAKNIIGFIFCYQDLLNTREKSLVVKTLARDANKKWSGLGNLLVNTIIQRAKYEKYQSIIHAFMIEEGASTRLSKKSSWGNY